MVEEKLAAPVIVDRGPSPVEIARLRALEQREKQLEQSIEEVAALRKTIMAETEQQLVELAAAIARRVIGKELSLDPEILLGLAAEGLDALAQGDKVRVRVGAAFDEASIATFRDRVKARASHVEVTHDDKLGPGGCIVETELGRVDESVELRLASVLAHLFGQSDGSDFPGKGG
jgi:flagellar assembly protein FliH